ncbi:MAG: epoxyqueuosine reductase [Deltaproteobacteria bacterium]|jgi:epoxyqueuosine reductase|nr:epoxyqueuosine reductase [Deltaproteobacteria bacterium]MBT4638811.1 epoxyqueuosine reductase [Deltaproteobacteria bacterium]MBT6502211.1 epoxyqueuosine reductase [Deltaproteobacteria bacterium]MBT7716658.1 epoxyqueuosine reductase [Deltaproteobacteria bacterium]
MNSAEERLKSLAKSLGADLVGLTTKDILADGPPSANPRYLLPSANSVISFALSLDKDLVQDFISKKKWRPHCDDRKIIVQNLYKIGTALSEQLRSEGYEAVNVDLNNNYRPEKDADDVTEMTEFHPDFSHRYAALAAGIGRLGWSGNLLTKDYGALVELGSVLTSANLTPDTPIPDEEHPCDGCKMCSLVCPVEMIQPKISTQVTVAGVIETISRKRPNTCCWISCTGYEGLASSGTWSNWSPYRLGRPLPEDKQELDSLCISLQKADPQMQAADNSFNNYRQAVFDPDWFYYTVCGFCRTVCSSRREERLANRKLIVNSGTAALRLDGSHEVALENAVAVQTPFGMNVVVMDEKLSEEQLRTQKWPGQFPLDREVIKYLCTYLNSVDVKDASQPSCG